MSNQSDRATSSELAAGFERAMGSLADEPIPRDDAFGSLALIEEECSAALFLFEAIGRYVDPSRAPTDELAARLIRIAAIALEGAARLRRGT